MSEIDPLIPRQHTPHRGSFRVGIIITVSFVCWIGLYFTQVSRPMAFSAEKCTWNIYIIRHAERDARFEVVNNQTIEHRQLTNVGLAHADFLGKEAFTLFPDVKSIYATKPTPPHNAITEIQTAKPIGKAFGIEVNAEYTRKKKEMKKLGRKIFREGRCGENVLIVWDHKKVQSLIDLLGGCI